MEKQQVASDKLPWLLHGLIWGFIMFLFMSIVWPYVEGEVFTWKKILLGFVLWMLGGVAFGYLTKLINKKS